MRFTEVQNFIRKLCLLPYILFVIIPVILCMIILKYQNESQKLRISYNQVSNMLDSLKGLMTNSRLLDRCFNFTENFYNFFENATLYDDMFKQNSEHVYDIDGLYVNEDVIEKHKFKMKHPVMIIPGFGSSCLDIIESPTKSNARIWGGVDALNHFLTNRKDYIEHILVNKEEIYGEDSNHHGSDKNKMNKKPKIKIRANESQSSISHLFPSYWVWHKLLLNLQAIGYDIHSLEVCPYDWRLSFYELEKRDKFFSRLKSKIEMMKKMHNKKIVLVVHSLGGLIVQQLIKMIDFQENGMSIEEKRKKSEYQIKNKRKKKSYWKIFYFIEDKISSFVSKLQNMIYSNKFYRKISDKLKFLHLKQNPGRNSWVNQHIESIINIGTPFLGVPRAMTGFLSGDWGLHNQNHFLKDFVLSSAERQLLLRDWRALRILFPVGKKDKYDRDTIWNGFIRWYVKQNDKIVKVDKNKPKIEQENEKISNSQKFTNKKKNSYEIPIIELSDGTQINSIDVQTLMSFFEDESKINKGNWIDFYNPLEFPLPYAPDLTIYSFYGWQLKTEAGYIYKNSETDNKKKKSEKKTIWKKKKIQINTTRNEWYKKQNWQIDREVYNDVYQAGVISVDGDGTVPLISMGYVAGVLWRKECCFKCGRPFNLEHAENNQQKNKKIYSKMHTSENYYNPSNLKTVIREYRHEPVSFWLDVRGGTRSANHTNILGNQELVFDVLKVVSGYSVEERIESNLLESVKEIDQCDCYNEDEISDSNWIYSEDNQKKEI